MKINSVELRSGGITFTWEGEGSIYRIFRDDDLIFKDRGNKLEDNDLIPGEVCIYTLEGLEHEDDEEPAEKLMLQVTTGPKTRNPDNILQEMSMAAAVSATQTELFWEEIEGAGTYDVYKNGEKVTVTDTPRFKDEDTDPGEYAIYWIMAERPLEDSEESLKRQKSLIARAFGAVNPDLSQEEPAMEKFRIMKKIGPTGNLLKQDTEDITDDTGKRWELRYTTFLGEKLLENPNVLSAERYFEGDGRGFDAGSEHYRTRADISINFSEAVPDVKLEGKTGTSRSFDQDKELREEEAASNEGIVLKNIRKDGENLLFTLDHSVGNPLVASPEVKYEVHVVFNRNGYFDIAGKHDQSPNHEVYLKGGNSEDWEAIHQAENKGLAWMAPPIANQHWRSSNFE
ncbi:DUF3238 domain-containing protein [Evansella sp. LMS18]|uniref:DUF3238 domain-containing protein n=1 Tax=Evansella sp. LMS18 TaxID=2924033 RepID=UPI0020D1C568|nr:DUF3238 domain-containing protein [Evansella sp. LMS18]UTR08625.1 DUF3238 domain-containing protein [Evansella sp. LMS18]